MNLIPYLILAFAACALCAQAPTKEELNAALKENPVNRSALYNLGLVNYMNGTPEQSIDPWIKLESLEPKDWQLKAKIIQAYSASGRKKERDVRIKDLQSLRSSGKYPDLNEATFFIRDQFRAGEYYVYVFDYYDMDADWRMGPIAWKFYLTKDGEAVDRFISLGSYDATTQIARELGDIGGDDRVFHLDEYWSNGNHATHGIYKNIPEYDPIKAKVVQILKGEASPRSSLQPGAIKAE
ncbi:MAG TPA: hypothetical protein DCX06_01085 [Opitutae bacterium]|nr:hypothetical protein [Opitutae bacterium]